MTENDKRKKEEKAYVTFGTTANGVKYVSLAFQKERRERKEQTIFENFSNFDENYIP